MDENTCAVDIARYFVNFTQTESCGKCTPCRMGTKEMLDTLTRITKGKGSDGDMQLLESLGKQVRDTALCGLGRTCPNPVLTTINYFRDEYEAHIKEKRCPALVCDDLCSYYILSDKCQGCLICHRSCPVEAIKGGKRMVHIIDQSKCTKCGMCFSSCPARFSAVIKVSGESVPTPEEPVPVSKAMKGELV
jgi:NADH-quinone oxidoreductase subunit F